MVRPVAPQHQSTPNTSPKMPATRTGPQEPEPPMSSERCVCTQPPHSFPLLTAHSFEDGRHTLGFWLCIPRTRGLQEPQSHRARPRIPLDLRTEAHLHRPRSAPATQVRAVLPAHHPHDARKVRAVRDAEPTRLRARRERTGSRRPSRDRAAGGDYRGPVAEERGGCYHHDIGRGGGPVVGR